MTAGPEVVEDVDQAHDDAGEQDPVEERVAAVEAQAAERVALVEATAAARIEELQARTARAEADAAARVQENADLRERVGRAEATAEARGVEVERLLHVVDRLTRAIGGAPDVEDEPRVVVQAVAADVDEPSEEEPVKDGTDGTRGHSTVRQDAGDEDTDHDLVTAAPSRRGLLARLLGRR